MNIKRQIIPPIIAMTFVISSGMIGYTLIEKWSLFDSLYMTIVTLTTVGFEEVHTLTRPYTFRCRGDVLRSERGSKGNL